MAYSRKGVYLHLILFLLNRFWFECQIKLPASKQILLLRNLHILERRGIVVLICISLLISDVEQLFLTHMGHLYVFFGKMSI